MSQACRARPVGHVVAAPVGRRRGFGRRNRGIPEQGKRLNVASKAHAKVQYLRPMERTEISDLGEFGLIRRLTKDWPTHQPSTLRGVGDDAAVLDPGGQRVVMSTDMLCEGVHFDLSYAPLKHLGYKAVVVNLSDVCAMNAKPTQVVVGLGLSNRFSVEAVEDLYAGIRLACDVYQVDLVGGDTTSSPAGLTLGITAVGLASNDAIVEGMVPETATCWWCLGTLGRPTWDFKSWSVRKPCSKQPPLPNPSWTTSPTCLSVN